MATPSGLQPSPTDGAAADAAPSRAHRQTTASFPRVVSSETLLAGAPQLAIVHNKTIYYLRQTRFGKLILTK